MSKPLIHLDPELGTKAERICVNCGKLMYVFHIDATSVFVCQQNGHTMVLVEHPPGASPAVFSRLGLKDLEPDAVLEMILGNQDEEASAAADLVCPFPNCGFVSDSQRAYELHLQYHRDQ